MIGYLHGELYHFREAKTSEAIFQLFDAFDIINRIIAGSKHVLYALILERKADRV